MCSGCWDEYGSPTIDNARVREALAAVNEVYEYSCVGGNLHAQLDDWNIDDHHWNEFEDYSAKYGGDQASEAQLAVERRCFDLMRALSLDERASVLALRDGFIG